MHREAYNRSMAFSSYRMSKRAGQEKPAVSYEEALKTFAPVYKNFKEALNSTSFMQPLPKIQLLQGILKSVLKRREPVKWEPAQAKPAQGKE